MFSQIRAFFRFKGSTAAIWDMLHHVISRLVLILKLRFFSFFFVIESLDLKVFELATVIVLCEITNKPTNKKLLQVL